MSDPLPAFPLAAGVAPDRGGRAARPLLKAAVSGEKFQDLFFTNCQDDAIAAHIKSVLKS